MYHKFLFSQTGRSHNLAQVSVTLDLQLEIQWDLKLGEEVYHELFRRHSLRAVLEMHLLREAHLIDK